MKIECKMIFNTSNAKKIRTLVIASIMILSSFLGLFSTTFVYMVGITQAAQGGPDGGGYNWTNNTPPAPMSSYNWIEINETGTSVGPLGDEEVYGPYSIGFNFDFYGATKTQFYIGNNGALLFNYQSLPSNNPSIPSTVNPDELIAPFWDDLGDKTGGIYYETRGSAPNRYLVVQWDEVCHYSSGTENITFQAILYETWNSIKCQYQDVFLDKPSLDFGASATVGIENADGSIGLEYLKDGSPRLLANDTAVEFSRGTQSYDLILTPVYQENFGDPTDDVDHILSIANTGSGDDTYDLSSVNTWSLTFRDIGDTTTISSIFVAVGTSENFIARVTIPGSSISGEYDLAEINATSWGDPAVSDTAEVNTTVRYIAPFFDDFDPMLTGWSTQENGGGSTVWQHGVPTNVGPSSSYSSPNCWGTNIASDYDDNADEWLITPPILIPINAESANLSFMHWYETEPVANYDGGFVEINNGSGWQVMDPNGGYPTTLNEENYGNYTNGAYGLASSGWVEARFNISGLIGETVRFKFVFTSDNNANAPGWYIDNVNVSLYFTVPTATVTGPVGGPTNVSGINIEYITALNPPSAEIWYTTDSGSPYTWTSIGIDSPADGNYSWTVPADGSYGWFANTTNESSPTPSTPPEASYYIYDGTSPTISSTTPLDGEIDVISTPGTYVIEFSEPMTQILNPPNSDLPGVEWNWDPSGLWLNGSYDVLDILTTYYVDLAGQGFKDSVGNDLTGDMYKDFTTSSVTTATVTGPTGGPTKISAIYIEYAMSGSPPTVELWYTTNSSEPYTWTSMGIDSPGDGNYSWTVPDDGSYGWYANTTDQIAPTSTDTPEASYYIFDGTAPTIISTTPLDEEIDVSITTGTYAIQFSEPMNKTTNTPDSNLPGVVWNWNGPGTWLSGAYGTLNYNITYYVNLTDRGFGDLVDNWLWGDTYKNFTTRELVAATAEGPTGGPSNVSNINILYSTSGSPSSVMIWYTTDTNVPYDWNSIGIDSPADGIYPWTVPSDGSYGWFANASDDPYPGATYAPETSYYIYDGTAPSIFSTTPVDGAMDVSIAPGTYVIEFTEPMNQTSSDPSSNLPGITWAWAPSGLWLNGSYGTLNFSTTYNVDLTGLSFKDVAGNDLSGDMYKEFTTKDATTATVVGPTSEPTNVANINIQYSTSGGPPSAQIWYTTDTGSPYTWASLGIDRPADGVFAWTVPSDGSYGWFANTTEQSPPGPTDAPEASYYIYDGTPPLVFSTSPIDGVTDVNNFSGVYIIEFNEPMNQTSSDPLSNLPGVSWAWAPSGLWLNGSYGALNFSTTFFVDLAGQGFVDLAGNDLSGDIYKNFTTRDEIVAIASSPAGGPSNVANINILYSTFGGPSQVEIWYTTNTSSPYTWISLGLDNPADGTFGWTIPSDGSYGWFANATDDLPPGPNDSPEASYYIYDGTEPTILSTTPFDGALDFSIAAGKYVIKFDEPMNQTLNDPLSNIPGVIWTWAPSGLWLNGSYGTLDFSTTYSVDLTGQGFKDLSANGLSGDMYKEFTTRDETSATVTGPIGGPTNVANINIQYSVTGSPSSAEIWYTTDTSPPYTWTSLGVDDPADGTFGWTILIDGSYGWIAATIDEPSPTSTDAPEASFYIYDGTDPSISFTVPNDVATGVSTAPGTYVIKFDEPMATMGTPLSDLPGVSWVWSPSGLWLNGSYGTLSFITSYYVNLTGQGFQDPAGNDLKGDMYKVFTTAPGTTATATGPTGGPTNIANINILYTTSGSPPSVEIWYTTDTSFPYIWTSMGVDDPADGTFAWMVPSDGSYGWFVNTTDETSPTSSDAPQTSYYIYDGTSPSISSTTPNDGAVDVTSAPGTYVINFDEEMTATGTPLSDLPGVTWVWSSSGLWLNGSYGVLDPSTTYYVNLTGQGFVDLVGNDLSGDMYKEFTTSSGTTATVTGPTGGPTNSAGINIIYVVSGSPSSAEIWYTTDTDSPYTWISLGTDSPADGSYAWTVPSDGSYGWFATTIHESSPGPTDVPEASYYIFDGTAPSIFSTEPADAEINVTSGPGTYVLKFDEPMAFLATPLSDLPGVSWEWAPSGRWLNGSYTTLTLETTYYVDLTGQGFQDLAGNILAGDTYKNFTTAPGTTAKVTGPTGGPTKVSSINIKYSVSGSPFSAEIWYTTDTSSPYTWTSIGIDIPADGNYGWTVPADGSYGWFATTDDESPPEITDAPEALYYIYDGTAPKISSTIPIDGAAGVTSAPGTYVIKFNEKMTPLGTPLSNLPGVSWIWDISDRWLNGSYEPLSPSTTYYVNLTGQGFVDIVGNDLSGDLYKDFTTKAGTTATVTGPIGGPTRVSGINILYVVSGSPSNAQLWYTTNTVSPYTWISLGTDSPADGSYGWTVPADGSYGWFATTSDESSPAPTDPPEASYYIYDGTSPWISSTTPSNGEVDVTSAPGKYSIRFNEPMASLGTPLSDLPGVSWSWSSSRLWLNGTYEALDLLTTYYVDLTGQGFKDPAGNGLSGDMYKDFTTRVGTTATVTGPTIGPTYVAAINIQYVISGGPSSAEIWYTTDTSSPYTWISIGTDSPADGSYGWTIPGDGYYGWFATTSDESSPSPTDPPEASYYIYDGTAPSIFSTTPFDGAVDVTSAPGTYSIRFNEPMASSGTPLSDLPGVSWSWSSSRLWLNGTYGSLDLLTTYYVDLTGQGFKDIAGNAIVGDMFKDFTTRVGTTATVTGPVSGPTNIAGIFIQYVKSGNPTKVQLWYTMDTSSPYTWTSIGIDVTIDGYFDWTVPADGSYGWFANTTDESPPGPEDVPEASYYIYDGTGPLILSTTPTDGAMGVPSVPGTYVIRFNEQMVPLGTPLSDLPGISWVWAPSGLWLNGSYEVLSPSSTYYVDLTGSGFEDIVGNDLSGDMYKDFTTATGTTATVTGPLSGPTTVAGINIQYVVSGGPSSAQIWYTTDTSAPYSWILIGTDSPADGSYGWTVPADGSYGWYANTPNESSPAPTDTPEASFYIYDGTAPTISLTTPADSSIDITSAPGTYSIKFNEPMASFGMPSSDLPGVIWSWSPSGLWLNGSYEVLDPSTAYYVDLTAQGFEDPAGNGLSGDLYKDFTTRVGSTATVIGPVTGPTNVAAINIQYVVSGSPSSAEIWYTTDKSSPYTWISIGTDGPVDGIYGWTIPADGYYGWYANTADESAPSSTDSPEASYYIYDGTAPSIFSTTPSDGEVDVTSAPETYSIRFNEPMTSSGMPSSDLPGVLWSWSTSRQWLNGTYNALNLLTTYYVDLAGQGFKDAAGNALVGDMFRDFTTRAGTTATVIGPVSGPTNAAGIIIQYVISGNPFSVNLWYTMDASSPYTWISIGMDSTMDGYYAWTIPADGSYGWFANTPDESSPSPTDSPEASYYIFDGTPPLIFSTTPTDGATGITSAPGSYSIMFDEPMAILGAPLSDLPGISWVWSSSGLWLNGSYGALVPSASYFVDLTGQGFVDPAGNDLSGDLNKIFSTAAGTTATATGPKSGSTNLAGINIHYVVSGSPSSAQIWYTTDTTSPYTWISIGTDSPADGNYGWTVPADGSYGWFANTPDESPPFSTDAPEASYYIYDGTSPSISLTVPSDGALGVGTAPGIYVIRFDEPMSLIGTPLSDLPGVSWVWAPSGLWINGTYGALNSGTIYFVDLTGRNFVDLAGNELSQDMFKNFTTPTAATVFGPIGGPTNVASLNLQYTLFGNPSSVEIWYTTDTSAPYTWIYIGTDSPADGNYGWTVPGDGFFGWFANTPDESPPDPSNAPEASYYIYDGTSPLIFSSIPADGAIEVDTIAGVYVIEFNEPMSSIGTPLSDLPGVSWVWAPSGLWINGSYGALDLGTVYFVNLTGLGFQDLAGNDLSGDMFRSFTVILEKVPPTIESVIPTGTDVDITMNIVITFNESMNRLSVENAFTYTDGTSIWNISAGVVSWSATDNIMTFNATLDFVYGKVYTVRIDGTLAKDANGNLLDGNKNGIAEGSAVDDYLWQFTVESAPPIPDTTKPISSVSTLSAFSNSLSIQLSYTSSDDDSGVTEVELFFKKEGGEWTLYNTYTNVSDTVTFTADSDGTYSFYTRARDNENNYEDAPTSFDAIIMVDTNLPTIDAGSDRSANSEFTQNSITNDTGSGIDTYDWIKVSGPGNIIFGSENAPSTTIRASTEGTYSIRLTVTDKAGNSAIDEFTLVWDTTRPSVESKGPSRINVPITTVVTITFSEPLDKSQFESYFSISPTVQGTFTWNDTGTVLTFTPSSDLAYGTVYTINIEAEGIVDIAGNTIFNDLEFTFKTAAGTPSGFGRIEGQVKDENGNPIKGAMVSLEGTTFSTTTDSNGNYSFINVPTGIYNLTIESTGYIEKTTSVTVFDGGNTKLPATTMISVSEEPEEEGPPISLILIIVIIVVVILLVFVVGKRKKTKEDNHQGMKDSISEPTHKEPGDEEEMEGYLKEEVAGEPSDSRIFECPLCNTMASEDAGSCPGCGAIFSSEEEDHTSEGKEEESTTSEEENPYFKCPECGTYMYTAATSCPGCGVSFATEEEEKIATLEEEPAYFECPECGTHVEADATSCPGCGVGFAD